jgi:Na+/H+ antiporter NhaD/arsenite permease-like protein
MHLTVLLIFGGVYLGMILGEIPGLRLDRAGIALVATGHTTPLNAWVSVDVNTIALLFGLMIVSAQFRLFGFYTWVGGLASGEASPIS